MTEAGGEFEGIDWGDEDSEQSEGRMYRLPVSDGEFMINGVIVLEIVDDKNRRGIRIAKMHDDMEVWQKIGLLQVALDRQREIGRRAWGDLNE